MDSQGFGEMRALLHEQPSWQVWERLCAMWSAPEAAARAEEWLPYAEQMLARWPWEWRSAPYAWGAALLRGEAPVAWPLVRVWRQRGEEAWGADTIKRLCEEGALVSLRSVALRGLEDETLGAVLNEASSLVELYVRGHALSEQGVSALLEHPVAKRLEALTLIDGQMSMRTLASLWCARWGALRSLGVSKHTIARDEPLSELISAAQAHVSGVSARLPAQRTLEDVRLMGLGLTAEELDALMGAGLPQLLWLNLGANQLGDEGARVLGMCHLPKMYDLALGDNGITHVGVRHITEAPWVVNLKSLFLSGNDIGADGCDMLADCPDLSIYIRWRYTRRGR